MRATKRFGDYKTEAAHWITLSGGEFYPDILQEACQMYLPVLQQFEQLVKSSESSERLFLRLSEIPSPWMRVQLARIFRKYVSPGTPVEMLKSKAKAEWICQEFGQLFRPIVAVQKAFASRPMPDEALCALLWEYKSRGQKGYDLTEKMFALFGQHFPALHLSGPRRAGKDILLGEVFSAYPKADRPADFVIWDEAEPLAIGFARYDGDRGGAQEDDRLGGNREAAKEFLSYAQANKLRTKVIFVNDGPGLLLGSMWDDYAQLEDSSEDILVVTLRMIAERIHLDWLKS